MVAAGGAACYDDFSTHVRITPILDWEMSGWYLHYSEFAKLLKISTCLGGALGDWRFLFNRTEAIGAQPAKCAIDTLNSRRLD